MRIRTRMQASVKYAFFLLLVLAIAVWVARDSTFSARSGQKEVSPLGSAGTGIVSSVQERLHSRAATDATQKTVIVTEQDVNDFYVLERLKPSTGRQQGEQENDDVPPAPAKPVSQRIRDMADTTTTQELLDRILASPGSGDGSKPSEDSAIAVWALALQLSRNPAVLEKIREALLSPGVPAGAAYSLLGILARYPKEESIVCLLEMARLERPKWFKLMALQALAGGGCPDHIGIEEYMRDALDPMMDTPSGRVNLDMYFSPTVGTPRRSLLRDDVATLIVGFCRDELAKSGDSKERSQILGLLRALVKNESEAGQVTVQGAREQYPSRQWPQEAVETLATYYRSGQAPPEDHEAILRALTLSKSLQSQMLLLEAIANEQDWRARAVVAQLRVDDYLPELRAQAQSALWQTCREDPSERVRRYALFALPRTDEVRALIVAHLLESYKSGDYSARIRAVVDFGLLGADGLPYLEHIAATDADDGIREAASSQVGRIRQTLLWQQERSAEGKR